jgi:DNA-binding GntR family transcriptional regulator
LKRAERELAGHDRIYSRLLAEIVDGSLAAGMKLVEATLAERLSVSRTPVREALFRLCQEGFVSTEMGRGFSVKPLDEREARELFPILADLESLALSLAAPLVALDVEALKRANAALAPLKNRPRDAIEADTAFHALLLRRCPNVTLIGMIDGVRRQLLRYEHVYMSDETLIDLSMAQHAAIIACVAKADFAGAARALQTNYDSGLTLVAGKLARR